MAKKSKFNESEDLIRSLVDKNVKQKEIASQLGMSVSSLQVRCRLLGIKYKNRTEPKIIEHDGKDYARRMSEGEKLESIANSLGISKSTVSLHAKKYHHLFEKEEKAKLPDCITFSMKVVK